MSYSKLMFVGLVIIGLVYAALRIASIPGIEKEAYTKGRVAALTEVRDALYEIGKTEYDLEKWTTDLKELDYQEADAETQRELDEIADRYISATTKSIDTFEGIFMDANISMTLKGWRFEINKHFIDYFYYNKE